MISRKTYFLFGLILLALSIIDAVFTDFGIQAGWIEEANPFVRIVYETGILPFYLLKVGLPLLLLWILLRVDVLSYLSQLLKFAVFIYIFVFGYHLFWSSLV
ncbi:DUF5658 family protein [Anaerobacillus sp. MEB173]|uniref:DUF5658 family protein n=1 Tax=Anaerobacillus sp. MEB173 TaxID=3383345 RepID=UPI003F8E3247